MLCPFDMYESIVGLGDLKTDNVIIQLADRSNVYPRGLLEDVLVQVDRLIFPADFTSWTWRRVLNLEIRPPRSCYLLVLNLRNLGRDLGEISGEI